MTRPQAIDVNLLTGFLGSGKTTLLRRVLRDPSLANTAVLINEFGEVGLDHHLIERVDDTTVLLESGCICCTVRGELSEALRDIYARRQSGEMPTFKRVVIESTGLADPFPILSTLRNDPVLTHHFQASSVIATIDAVNIDQHSHWPEFFRQAASADTIVMTKSDLLTPDQRGVRLEEVQWLNPQAQIIDSHFADWRASELFAPCDLNTAIKLAQDNLEEHFAGDNGAGHHPKAFSISIEQPLDWTRFGIWLSMLTHAHGSRILRVKAILNLLNEPLPVAVHSVQYLVHPPHHMESWPNDDRSSRLVFIVDGLDPELIRRSFYAFLTLEDGVFDAVS